jgi:CRISPR/Cas system-associated exonuclease Cas4 (RecB family)
MSARTWLTHLALALSAAASLVAALLWYQTRRVCQRWWWLSTSRVVASDTGAALAQTIRDPTNGLRGSPDYFLAQGVGAALRIVPLELKPQRRSRRLYESDEVQLGVYLLAARATYGILAAPFGFVRYARAEFRVELTRELERRVLEVAASIRTDREGAVVHRSHEMPARCAGCPVRHHCDESLV